MCPTRICFQLVNYTRFLSFILLSDILNEIELKFGSIPKPVGGGPASGIPGPPLWLATTCRVPWVLRWRGGFPRDRRPRGRVPPVLRPRGSRSSRSTSAWRRSSRFAFPWQESPRQRQSGGKKPRQRRSHGKPATATSIPRNAPRSRTDGPLCDSYSFNCGIEPSNAGLVRLPTRRFWD